MNKDSTERVLLVDDDPNILAAYRRQLGRRFKLQTASGGEEAFELLRTQGPFAVVVSDLRMPRMDGIRFLALVRKAAPDTVRIMLTGQADLEAAAAAVNEGSIFRFLTKPCPTPVLAKALEDGLEQYRLVTAERVLLEKTLSGAIRVFTEILSMVSPLAFSRASRIKRVVKDLTGTLGLANAWRYELAAMFSQIGCVALPPDILQKAYAGKPLTEVEKKLFEEHPKVGAKLLGHIPRLEKIARMVENQTRDFCDFPPAQREANDPVVIGAQLLKTADDYDRLVSGGLPPSAAAAQLAENTGKYHPKVLRALVAVSGKESGAEKRALPVEALAVGMILEEEVTAKNGLLLVAKGQEITPAVLERLRNFKQTIGVSEPIHVRVPVPSQQDGGKKDSQAQTSQAPAAN